MNKYTLIVAEKPDTAERIATALDINSRPVRLNKNGVPYFRAYRNGQIIIVPSIGHLYTITSKNKKSGYPVFNYRWVPRWQAEKGATKIRTWLNVFSELAGDAECFVDACDFDLEGSIIGYTILKYACGEKHLVAKRMKYSTLTEEDLQQAYNNMLPKLDFSLIEAGLTRHEIDWLYGINLSRAMTQAAKKVSGQYAVISTGRVQGPTLYFLEEREKDIKCFVPTPWWQLAAKLNIDGLSYNAQYEKKLEILSEAKALRDICKEGHSVIEKVEVKEFAQHPPVPFDLGSLQSEAYKLFRYSPLKTSNALQHLYTNALISYPRTSSQKLPSSIGYRKILKKIGNANVYSKQVAHLLAKTELKPNEGENNDPAHPAIYPTGNLPQKSLSSTEKNILDLVIKRFMAVFGESAIRSYTNIKVNVNNNPFHFVLIHTIFEGWFKFYRPYVQYKDDVLPTPTELSNVKVEKILLEKHFTQPPLRYNPRSLLLKMEKEKIGTKSTRAAIMQTLQERKYLNGTDHFAVSDLGFSVVDVLGRYCPTVISPEMTRTLEAQMESVEQGREIKEKVIENTIEKLEIISTQLITNELIIGSQLSSAIQKVKDEERTIGICNKCKKGKLLILKSKKSGKRFVGCSNYFKGTCDNSYPLPQNGIIKSPASECKSCGSPVITVYVRSRKPWKFCLNPQCPSKEH